MRTCKICFSEKSTEYFVKQKNCIDGITHECKSCQRIRTDLWKKENPERVAETNRRSEYKAIGSSLEEYNELFFNQQGCCDICNRHQSVFQRRLSLDHNHITGKVRALLCGECNMDVGVYENRKLEIEKYLDRRDM